MLILFYDTETTGLPIWKEPSDGLNQPHIVSIGAKLVNDKTRRVLQSLHLVIEPTVWDIPDDVAKIHGITTEQAKKIGVPEDDVALLMLSLMDKADIRIAHNEPFDARIMRIALKRIHATLADQWKEQQKACTGRMSAGIVPCRGRIPSLPDAYSHFTGEHLVDHHDAMADVDACMAIYWALQESLE